MRNSLKIAVLILCTICLPFTGNAQQTTGKEDRAFWVENLTRIADPVLVQAYCPFPDEPSEYACR